MIVHFTEYVLPNGAQRLRNFDVPDILRPEVEDLIGEGCAFEMEVLRTGEVSLTIERADEETGDHWVLAHELVEEESKVSTEVLESLILAASKPDAGI